MDKWKRHKPEGAKPSYFQRLKPTDASFAFQGVNLCLHTWKANFIYSDFAITEREENRLRVSEDRVFTRTLAPKGGEFRGDWGTIARWRAPTNITSTSSKGSEMCGACMGRWEMRSTFWLESLKGRDYSEGRVDWRIILKWICGKNTVWICGLDSCTSGKGSLTGCC
jgi:hypothetical protein